MLASYIPFVRQYYRLLAFGLLMMFVGNYGQTFFVAVFGGEWRAAFGMSHTEYSAYYSSATLASGFLLMWGGAKLDSSYLKTFTLWVIGGVLIATLVLATASNPYWLLLGFFLIRFCGQGLSTHTSMTSMAKLFDKNRGKAISVAAMGMPIGEFLLPLTAALLIALLGWRWAWAVFGLFLLFALLPAVLWSLKDPELGPRTERAEHRPDTVATSDALDHTHDWTRQQVVRDPRFWLAVPAILSPAVIITGVFFHQAYIAETRGWQISWIASSMTVYAVTHAIGSFVTGPLVDRFGAQRVLRGYLLPLVLSLFGLLFDSFAGWVWFMVLSGFSIGASGPTVGSLWPEVYGTLHLGAIRSLVTSLMVVSTAIAPVLLGVLIDEQIPLTSIIAGVLGYGVFAWLLCQRVYQQPRK